MRSTVTTLKGFVYSVPGFKDRRPIQWSHMLGVTRDARGMGLGLRLKLAQRERALAMGIEEIEWTFDPLQAPNAHLNIARLGAVVEEYEENIYGVSTSPLHHGSPTDRLIAVWRLATPHVERRLTSAAGLTARDASVLDSPIVNPSTTTGGELEPGAPDLTRQDRRLLVEIPGDFTDLLTRDPDRARRWRMATRLLFQSYFSHGYRVVDFLSAPIAVAVSTFWKSGTTAFIPAASVNRRPASRCRWMWKTVWPASAFVLKTVRKPPSAYPLSRAIAAARRTSSPTRASSSARERVQALDVLARHDQRVQRGLRIDVGEGDDVIVAVDDRRRNLAFHDPAEQAISSSSSASSSSGHSQRNTSVRVMPCRS